MDLYNRLYNKLFHDINNKIKGNQNLFSMFSKSDNNTQNNSGK